MEEKGRKRYTTPYISAVFPALKFNSDVVDFSLRQPCISNLDIFFLISSIIMHLIDIAFDINIAVRYLLANKVIYFTWTLLFLFIPSFINVIISRRMQRQDKEIDLNFVKLENHKSMQITIKRKVCCMVAVVLQLAPVIRYCNTLIYALKARKYEKIGDYDRQKQYYFKMLKEDQDVALLRVFECFLEAAPQQILQLTILLKHYNSDINLEYIHQVGSIISSLASMGWAMASYNRSIRLAQCNKEVIGICGSICQFFWHFFITVSRILTLSAIASVWPSYTIAACICHWIIMTIWIIVESHGLLQFCLQNNRPPHVTPTIVERLNSILFASVIGLMHIFIYLNIVDGNTFIRHVFFYGLYFCENLIAHVLRTFIFPTGVTNAWFSSVSFLILCIVFFLFGIIAMILYYTLFHPTKKYRAEESNLGNQDGTQTARLNILNLSTNDTNEGES